MAIASRPSGAADPRRRQETLARWLAAANVTPVRALLGAAIVIGVAMRFYNFTAPILDSYTFRQTQTASEVWLWDRFGFDLFSYHVPMFGGGYWLLEYPFYQYIVYAMTKIVGFHEYLGRLVNIAAFVVGAILLYKIALRLFASRAAALVSVFFFAFLPVTVFYYRAYLIDPFILTVALLWVYAAIKLAERFTWGWCATYVSALLVTTLGKANLIVAFGLPVALLAVRMWRQRSTPKWGWVTLVGGAALTVVLFVLWARHADAVNQASSGMTFENMRGWFFGSTITSTSLWTTVWQRFSDNLGTVGLVVVGLGAASIPTVRTRYRPELWALILSNVAYIAIFANLNRIHDYYQLPCYVTLSLLGGLGVWSVGRVVRAAAPAMARPAMAGILVVLAVTWGLYLMKSYYNPLSMALLYRDQGIELRAHTPDRRLVVLAEGADPNEPMLFYEARRIGWRIPSENQAAATSRIRGARDLGGIAVVLGPHGVPTYLPALARERGFRRSYQSPDMVVYTPA